MAKKQKPMTTKSGESREWKAADFKRAKPIREVAPEVLALMQREKAKRLRGRPKAAAPREMLSVRVDAELAALIKKGGQGYSSKVEAALWKAAHEGAFGKSGGARK